MENSSEDPMKERSDLSGVDGNEPSDVERRSNDDSDCMTKHEQDADMTKDNNYSHVVKTEEIRKSEPGNLKIIDDTDTDTTMNREAQIDPGSGAPIETKSNTDKSKYQVNSNVAEAASNKGEIKESENETTVNPPEKIDDEEDKDKQAALKKLRQRKTYEEEEDNERQEEIVDNKETNNTGEVKESVYEEDYKSEREIDYEAYYRAGERYVYFWKSHDIYSQWHKSWFHVDHKKFNCAEQFMMFKKAELFGDDKIADEILWCKDPRKIKALGREVRGFNPDIWQQYCLHFVKEGNKAKFTQNHDMLADLFFTYPKILVEASPYDSIWGIGLEADSPDAWDERTWHGTNYLGYVITEVRDDIMVERGMIDEGDRERYIDNLLLDAGYPVNANKTHRKVKGQGRETTVSNKKAKLDNEMDKQSSQEKAEYQETKQESYFLFSGGFLSQFCTAHFEVKGVKYSCAEQYMMYNKAVFFNDNDTAKKIIESDKPNYMKKLGRQVRGVNEETWRRHCFHFVKEGNMAKFNQNEKLQRNIVTTYPKVLVYAEPEDKMWGIGLGPKDTRSLNKHTWHGHNFLGYILTEVRDELMCQWGLIKEEKRTRIIEKLHDLWDTPVGDESHPKDMNYKDTGVHRDRGKNELYDKSKNQKDDQHRPNVNKGTGKHNDGTFEEDLKRKEGNIDGKGKTRNGNWFDGQEASGKKYHDKHNDDRHPDDRFYHAHGSNQRTNDRIPFAKGGYHHQGEKQHANNVPKAQTEYRGEKGNGQQTYGSQNDVQSDSNETWKEVSGRNKNQRNRNQSGKSDKSGVHKADNEDDTTIPENKAENKKSNKSDKSGQLPTTDKGSRQGAKGDQSHSTKSGRKPEKQSKRKEEIAIDEFDISEMMGKLSDKSSVSPSPKEEKETPSGKKSKHPEGFSDHAAQKGDKAETASVNSDQAGPRGNRKKQKKKQRK